MNPEERMKSAREELERDHRARLVQAFGEKFTEHPSYEAIVKEVAGGRYPIYAISERMGR